MATALDSAAIYILNWAPPSGNDPETYDLDADGGKSHGTDYVKLSIPIKILETCSTLKEPRDFPGGGNFVKAKGYWSQLMRVTGLIAEGTVLSSMDKLGEWKDFLRTEYTDDDLYLVIKWAANVYWRFMDGTTEREFCQGTPIREDLMFRWYHHKKFFVEVEFTWKNTFTV